jgi:membrane protein DedA with SNARE-associated domain
MLPFESFIDTYGYLAIILGSMVGGGEILLVISGFLAAKGYLNLYWVITAVILATIVFDQFLFILGRVKGRYLFKKFPRLNKGANYVYSFLENHKNSVMLGFRFIYGLRLLAPFALGASKVTAKRFAILNLVSAIIWAVSFCVAGYLLGFIIEPLIKGIRHFELLIVLFLLIFLFIIFFKLFLKHKGKKPQSLYFKDVH